MSISLSSGSIRMAVALVASVVVGLLALMLTTCARPERPMPVAGHNDELRGEGQPWSCEDYVAAQQSPEPDCSNEPRGARK